MRVVVVAVVVIPAFLTLAFEAPPSYVVLAIPVEVFTATFSIILYPQLAFVVVGTIRFVTVVWTLVYAVSVLQAFDAFVVFCFTVWAFDVSTPPVLISVAFLHIVFAVAVGPAFSAYAVLPVLIVNLTPDLGTRFSSASPTSRVAAVHPLVSLTR